ncbi:thioredoxin family protein [Tenacibaculum piscium]|uniref:Thioredoxin n=1 Tax=Tenacibaculum piscium TaxID=1458515 RepID=A0A2H1YI04_9FLAO|nr:thioredoxin family protein [Tenacibaculum piscium]MBE7629854.1 thioredoxin family protein [Tenacibaculum piscium]MBE7670266.1 thioredoxin family protein [Tenacibaculum piscium]MBE7690418.1 thioredoxin family protein [Tenacibaculum piscium]SOS75136.1 Thioredoxin [Tenacibaculum piscium]
MKKVIANSLAKGISYHEYRDLVKNLLEKGKSTGENQSEELLNYSVLNDKRMKRLDKTIKLTDEVLAKIKTVKAPQTWLVLSESWCGDAAQNLPVIHKMASENEQIQLKIVLRDENLALMDAFLTNGGRSIPKLIALDTNNEVLGTWGPRPEIATKMVADYKKEHGALDAEFKESLQVWYNKNKGVNLQENLMSLLK